MSEADERAGAEEDEFDIREAYPLMDAVARSEGWDDLEMDSYNVYAPSLPRSGGQERGGGREGVVPAEVKLPQGGKPMPSPLEWSAGMDGLFWNSVGRIILDDPRTDWSENLSLGYPFEVIREQVLQKGLADFSQGHDDPQYGRLTGHEKALLYCFVNFKKHFFSALATFEEYRADVEALFGSEERPFIVDIGCGPATAGLALADMLPGKNFDYLGADLAEPMRTKAASLWEAAQARGVVGKTSTSTFQPSWAGLVVNEVAPGRSVLVVLSYCCASHTLTLPALQSLAHTVLGLAESRAVRPLMLAYMNSTHPLAGVKYEVFIQALGLNPQPAAPTSTTIEYRKKRGGAAIGREEFVRQVLRIGRRT